MDNEIAQERQPTTTEILDSIAQDAALGLPIALGDFMQRLTDRAFGFGILLFALPNAIPLGIPGISSICAVPIFFFSIQMMLGYQQMNLPSWAARKPLPQRSLSLAIRKTLPTMRRIEKLIKPRMSWVISLRNERLMGALIFYHAFIMFLPLPGANFPSGVAMVILALALLEKDGLLGIIGWLYGIGSAIAMTYVWAMIAIKMTNFAAGLF